MNETLFTLSEKHTFSFVLPSLFLAPSLNFPLFLPAYLFRCLFLSFSLSQGLYIIRFHSFYPWHTHGNYTHLCNEKDLSMLPWVKEFKYATCDIFQTSTEFIMISLSIISINAVTMTTVMKSLYRTSHGCTDPPVNPLRRNDGKFL